MNFESVLNTDNVHSRIHNIAKQYRPSNMTTTMKNDMPSIKRTAGCGHSEHRNKKRLLTWRSVSKMATNNNAGPVSREVIDPEGDIILILPNAELQVSSKILCMTSKVFKAMLSTNFAEGNADAVGGLRRIDLPG